MERMAAAMQRTVRVSAHEHCDRADLLIYFKITAEGPVDEPVLRPVWCGSEPMVLVALPPLPDGPSRVQVQPYLNWGDALRRLFRSAVESPRSTPLERAVPAQLTATWRDGLLSEIAIAASQSYPSRQLGAPSEPLSPALTAAIAIASQRSRQIGCQVYELRVTSTPTGALGVTSTPVTTVSEDGDDSPEPQPEPKSPRPGWRDRDRVAHENAHFLVEQHLDKLRQYGGLFDEISVTFAFKRGHLERITWTGDKSLR